MIALLVASAQLRIISVPDNGKGVVLIANGRHRTRIVEDRFVDPPATRNNLELTVKVRFDGDTYSTNSMKLAGNRSKKSVEFQMDSAPQYDGLYAPGLRCFGGVNLGKSMLWIYAWKNFDVQLDPAVLVTAFEVGVSNGRLKILRKANLRGMVGYGGCGLYRQGKHLILTNSSRNLSVFDLDSWQELQHYVGSNYLSRSGRIYRITGSVLSLSLDGLVWKQLRKVDEGYLVEVHPLKNDDVLEFSSSLMLGKTGRTFRYESKKINGQQPQVFVHPRLGAGVVWDTYSSGKGPVGAWLNTSLRTLTPIWPRDAK